MSVNISFYVQDKCLIPYNDCSSFWVKMPYNPEFEKDKHQKGGGHHNLLWNIIEVSSPNQFVWDWKKRKEKKRKGVSLSC
jgi:hypothetical protein